MSDKYLPEMYEQKDMEIIDSHIIKYFGEYANVFHEIASPDIHVDICIIPPDKDHNYYTLVTMGMGAHQMNVPEELAEYHLERAELMITLPADWKLDQESMQDERWYWPIRLLKSTARLPGECDTWLGWGHTVATNEGETYAENTDFCGVILLDQMHGSEDACVCKLSGGEDVNFYQLIPLYREEMDYKCEHNADALLDLFEGLSFVVDINRPNVLESFNTKNGGPL